MATRTISNAGGNWNAVGAWVEGVVPVLGDAVVATGTSGQLTVNVASACTSMILTGYTNTLTMTSTLAVSGAVTLASGMTIAGAGVMTVLVGATLTANGKTWSGGITFSGTSQTYTLADAWIVNGTVTSNGVTLLTINGSSITCTTSLSTGGSVVCTGTTNFIMSGTGTWSGNGTLRNNLTFNTAGIITISGAVAFNTGTITYTAGTITTTGSTLTIAVSTTFNTSGMIWNAIILSVVVTITNNSALIMAGLLTVSGSGTNVINGSDWEIRGGYTASSGRNMTGTAKLVFGGSGTQNISHGNTASFTNNVDFNTSGTITFSNNTFYYGGGGTLTYIAGTITTAGLTLGILTSCTLNTNGITWNIINIAVSTVTLNSLLTATGTVTITGDVTFNGTSSFTFGSFICATVGKIITLKSTFTYTITASIVITGTLVSRIAFVSSIGGSKAILTLQNGATQDLDYCNATDIDSSLGATMWSYKGTITTCSNWNLMPSQPAPVSYAYMN